MIQLLFNAEEIKDELDISHLVIEDDKPVDNFHSAQQQRLLVDAVCSSKAVPSPFLAEANVGLFHQIKGDPIVPDVLLSLGVQRATDLTDKRNRSYFVWELGKLPEVCIEIVSNREGDEIGLSPRSKQKGKTQSKKDLYSDIGIPYYVVFDPLQRLQTEMKGALLRVWHQENGGYTELTSAAGIRTIGQVVWLEDVGLGLTLWEGCFEDDISRIWLRWCDCEGNVIPTGAEGMETERQRAEVEKSRAEAEKSRAEAEKSRAEIEKSRAEVEKSRAEVEKSRADRLAAQLRALGIDPESD
jgi:Uma2 family endonuclease